MDSCVKETLSKPPISKITLVVLVSGKKKMVAILVNKLNVLNEAIPQSQPD